MHPSRNAPVHAARLAAHQRGQFTQTRAVQDHVHVQPLRIHEPAALQPERSQPLRRTVRPRRLRFAIHLPRASHRTRRRNIQIRLRQIEDRFLVAKLEVNPAVANLYRRSVAQHGPIHERGEVPPAPLRRRPGFRQIDTRAFQPDGGNHETPAQQRPDARRDFHAAALHLLDVDDGLPSNRRIFVNRHLVHREARALEQAEMHALQFHSTSQRSSDRSL